MTTDRFHVVIPARYGSTRLPGKPLLMLAGKPMIQHVFENALAAGASEVIVATDDERIVSAVEGFGGRAMLTDPEHASGTDRIAEVAARAAFAPRDIVVNLQGDEPGIEGAVVCRAAMALSAHPEAGISTMAAAIRDVETLRNPNVVKVVLDNSGFAHYFSRAPIPWHREAFAAGLDTLERLPEGITYLRHIGIYGYRVEVLRAVSKASPLGAEKAEALEQLRALAMGIRIHVTVLEHAPSHGVDTVDDLRRVAARMEK
ncbi:MAG: 3-deoxy-manno-octulosonate cytidylyltransferase [Myxococcota bacterium]|jgi:3-deoxy-manno-octulosonate cytidylyltransferase (CMP-KDO synthetase)|nr:3-deoxy-manno-octulosonate cytidylyltransferase [Myxococcota bacterium]